MSKVECLIDGCTNMSDKNLCYEHTDDQWRHTLDMNEKEYAELINKVKVRWKNKGKIAAIYRLRSTRGVNFDLKQAKQFIESQIPMPSKQGELMSKSNEKSITLAEAKKQGFNKVVPCDGELYQCHSEIVGKRGEMFFLYPLENIDEEERAYGHHKSIKVVPDPKTKKIEEFKKKLRNCLEHQDRANKQKYDPQIDRAERKTIYEEERDSLKEALIEMYEESFDI